MLIQPPIEGIYMFKPTICSFQLILKFKRVEKVRYIPDQEYITITINGHLTYEPQNSIVLLPNYYAVSSWICNF